MGRRLNAVVPAIEALWNNFQGVATVGKVHIGEGQWVGPHDEKSATLRVWGVATANRKCVWKACITTQAHNNPDSQSRRLAITQAMARQKKSLRFIQALSELIERIGGPAQ